MNNISRKLDELTTGFTKEQNDIFIENRFPYILSKADSYIKSGPELYRKEDAFAMPKEEWSDEDLSLIMDGCLQIMEGVGYTSDKPFKKLGIRGFNLLFTMFHFNCIKRKSNLLGSDRIQDETTFEHAMDRSRVTYYNLVER